MIDPHYLRFARALALVSTVGAAACGDTHSPGADAGPDAGPTCVDCRCGEAPVDDRPLCDDIGLLSCCAVIGPLSPPDMPARAEEHR